jgi:hypothetical protein
VGDLGADGYALRASILTPEECVQLASRLSFGGAGARSLLAQPWCAALSERLRTHPTLEGMLESSMVAVQCSVFEKSAARNWLVPVHQDLSIPVAGRVADPALSGWSLKEGVQFVRAPAEVLAQLVAVRLHLDPCGIDDGPLRVVPGSHLHGVLSDDDALALRDAVGETVCLAPIGSALVMRPLLLHASSKGNGTGLRRVLHFVFGPRQLPHGLAWSEALRLSSESG